MMLHINCPHFTFLSKIKAIPAQYVFNREKHYKGIINLLKHFPLVNNVRRIVS